MTAIEQQAGALPLDPGGGAARPRGAAGAHRQMGAAARHHGARRSGCGTASASGTRSRTTSCRVRAWCCATLYTDRRPAVLLAAGDAADHLPQPAARGRRRRRAGGPVRPVEMGGDVVLPLRHRPAGDADRGDLPADQHLCRQPDGQAAAVRLDRRLLPDPVQHDARPEFRRPQPDRPVQAQRRDALAAALAPAGCPPRCPISSAA